MRYFIFIPAYNAEKTITDTLHAIELSAIYANSRPLVVVADDCSTDNTYKICEEYQSNHIELCVVRNSENLGERGTINFHYKRYKEDYDWFFLMHADDIPYENWLFTMAGMIDQYQNIFSIWSSYDELNDETGIITRGDNLGGHVLNYYHNLNQKVNSLLVKTHASFHISGALLNIKCLDEIGGFDANLPQFGDSDYFIRSVLNGYQDIYISECLTKYRIIKSSVSHISRRINRDIKERMYLLDKFTDVLSEESRRSIINRSRWIITKRIIKELLRCNLKNTIININLLFKLLKCK